MHADGRGWVRRFRRAITFALTIAAVGGGTSAAASTVPPEIGAEYVRPHQLVDVGAGRKINLFCLGRGARTVLFDSGLSDCSSIWALVQPGVANHARACSYDRAGMGYSDPSQEVRSPINIVEDMHKLVHGAGLKTPLILVGHSLGGFNVKLYAALYPTDVAGLVLVDPAEDRITDRTRAFLSRRFGTSIAARSELLGVSKLLDRIGHYKQCATAARLHDLDPSSAFYRGCTDAVRAPLGPIIAAERARLQVTRNYQEAQASELAHSVYADNGGDRVYVMLFRPGAFGNKPLIVLTHSIYDRDDLMDVAHFAAWNEAHEQTARLSRRGVNERVPNTRHNIEVDDPQSIIDAVVRVIRESQPARAKRRRR